MKKYFRRLVCSELERRVVKLRELHDFKVIAVAGSVGKTSTKLAVAKLLEQVGTRVRYQEGNYNDRVTVPLVFFDKQLPSLFNVFSWWRTFTQIDNMLHSSSYPYEYVVVELGTDGPGQLKDFAYIKPDITVLTAVSAEHMSQFGTLEAVAKEELSVAEFSTSILVNIADVDREYLAGLDYVSYAVGESADYSAEVSGLHGLVAQELAVSFQYGQKGERTFHVKTHYGGRQGATIALSAFAVAVQLGVAPQKAASAVESLRPFAGRLQLLDGVRGATIIDDTYNSSPLATRAALDLLYSARAKQKIAILGDMNELGEVSDEEHQKLGEYCRPSEIDLVVTIGSQARKHLAPAAKQAGCRVASFSSPVEAGKYVVERIQPGALVLAKGSQNGVFAEEAIKQLLKDPEDASSLVRQSDRWMERKRSL